MDLAMSLFRKRREVSVFQHSSGPWLDQWEAEVGSPSGIVQMARGDTPEQAVDNLRIRIQYEELRRSKKVSVDW